MQKMPKRRGPLHARLGVWWASVVVAGCQAGVTPDPATSGDLASEDATLAAPDVQAGTDVADDTEVLDSTQSRTAPPDVVTVPDVAPALDGTTPPDTGANPPDVLVEDMGPKVQDAGCSGSKDTTKPPPVAFGGQVNATVAHANAVWQPWTSGHPLAVQGGTVVALDQDNGTLVRLDRMTMKVLTTLQLGGRPQALVVAQDGTMYVTLRAAGTVAKVSVDGKLLATWTVGTEPMGLALSPKLDQLYVVLAGDRKLLALDPQTGAVLGQAVTGRHPTGVVALDGTVVVVDRLEPVRKYTTISLVPQGTSQGLAVPLSPEHGMIGVCGIPGKAIRALAAVRDPESETVLVPHVVVAPGDANSSITQAKGTCVAGGGSYGTADGCKTPRRPVEVAVSWLLHPNSNAGTFASDVGAPSGENLAALFDQPADIAGHPTHRLLLVAARGTDNVFVLATTPAGNVEPRGLIAVGQAPSGIAVSEDGNSAYVLNAQDFSVASIDLTPLLTFPGGAAPVLQQGTSVKIGEDPLPQAARLGRRTFTFARNPGLSDHGQFACATCHHEGAEDGQTWFIASGPRQTPALAERLAGTAPFNWLGSHDILTDNMADTVTRMGGKGLTAAEVTSLEQFLLTGLHAPQHPPTASVADVAAGKALFESPEVGCSGCHVAGKTDGMSHEVGTTSQDDLKVQSAIQDVKDPGPIAFDTPSLRDLFSTAPYFHDGSAADLDAVLKRSDAGTMGKTDQLTTTQRQQLKAYLLSL